MTRAGAERAPGSSAAWACSVLPSAGDLAPAQFPHAWLAAVTVWIGWPLGSMALIFIHALTGGRWGWAIRPQLGAGIATLPLCMPALLPLLFVLHALYPWMHADVAAHLDNRFYLNAPFFYARSVVYLIVWLGLGGLVLRALRQENPEPILYRIAPPGLILLALTVTFAAIDYTLSMEPRFKSSIYGMLVGCEGVLLALSIAVLGVTLARPGRAAGETTRLGQADARLLVFWAYLDFMQLLIVWQSDLPHEANWYVRGRLGGWAVVAAVVAACISSCRSSHCFGLRFSVRGGRWDGWRRCCVVIEVPRAWWIVIPAAGRTLSAGGCGGDARGHRHGRRNGAARARSCVARESSGRSWLTSKESSRRAPRDTRYRRRIRLGRRRACCSAL